MKTIRIGSGAGYGGDRIEPALQLIKEGDLDYIIFECLAERTIALAQKEKIEDQNKGYNPLLEYRMEKLIPLLKNHKVRVITNMGAANPIAAAEQVAEIAKKHELSELKIAAIVGDDILERITEHYETPILETGETLATIKDKIISANAYIGAKEISKALAQGADIVITGRVADPSLTVGPLMYEFNQDYENYDFLGKGTVMGHLLECAGQVTGGYFVDPGFKDVPDLWNLGFPIAEFNELGEITIEKLPNCGGAVTTATVKEQLLYEIQDPAKYYTPDVVADFSHLRVSEITKNKVQVLYGAGKEKTGTLKVSIGYEDGFIGEGEISYGGHNAYERAKLAGEVIQRRLEMQQVSFEEFRIDYIGINSLYKDSISNKFNNCGASEVRLRVAARAENEENAKKIGREVEALYTNGPYGGGGARAYVTKVVSVVSILVPELLVTTSIVWKGGIKVEAF